MSNQHTQSGQRSQKSAPAVDLNAEVARLIASQKMKQAVELAKENHKRVNNAESQKLLVDAYVNRIAQFQSKGQAEDAGTLIKLVRERFPAHAGRLGLLETKNAATGGLVDQLVAPLARPDLPAEQREVIENAIRQQLLDLPGLAASKALRDGHPLKAGAAAVWRAFEDVTAGPVSDDTIALPEISRKSPLMGWRMLVRAIAAFHRNDDESCRRALEAIPADAAVHRLTPVILDMITHAPSARGAVGALQSRITSADEPLRKSIAAIERSFNDRYVDSLMDAVAATLRAAETARPELTETSRLRMSVRCIATEVPISDVNRVMGGVTHDAKFWRLLARGYEKASASFMAALAWERFISHAISEKMFDDGGLEMGFVYLHMAAINIGAPTEAIASFKRGTMRKNLFAGFYQNQPPHIAALAPKDTQMIVSFALSPDELFRQAAQIIPDTETFSKWNLWSRYHEVPVKRQEDILLAWNRALPRDLEPLLQLSQLAEDRNALGIATKRVVEAEAIDPVNPKVRKARVRLILSTLWRHTKDRKPHLVAKDIAELEALPSFNEGDRGAFLDAVKAVWHTLKGDAVEAEKSADAVVAKMDPLAASTLLNSVAYQSSIDTSGNFPLARKVMDPDPVTVARADARLHRLCNDLNFTFLRPAGWDDLEIQVFRQKPCPLSPDEILWIAKATAKYGVHRVAYAATAAGLATATGAMAGQFLLVRGIALEQRSRARAAQCLRAALELARQYHDDKLTQLVIDEMAMQRQSRYSDSNAKPLKPGMLDEILASERKAEAFPATLAGADKFVVLIDNDDERPFFGGSFADMLEDEDEDDNDFDDDYDEDDEPEFEIPSAGPIPTGGINGSPELFAFVTKLITKYGAAPTEAQLAKEDPRLVAQFKAVMENMFGKFK